MQLVKHFIINYNYGGEYHLLYIVLRNLLNRSTKLKHDLNNMLIWTYWIHYYRQNLSTYVIFIYCFKLLLFRCIKLTPNLKHKVWFGVRKAKEKVLSGHMGQVDSPSGQVTFHSYLPMGIEWLWFIFLMAWQGKPAITCSPMFAHWWHYRSI